MPDSWGLFFALVRSLWLLYDAGSTDGGIVLRILIVVCALLVLAIPVTGWWLCQRALPVTDGVLTLEPLMHGAQIRFDDRGIPYIEASSDRDLWLVEGYVHASDRIFQMDMLRRAARGQMSEVFGDQCLVDDKLMRTVGIPHVAEAELKKLSQDVRAYLDAYSMGVNEYLRRNVKTLPLEFAMLAYRPEPWKPVDTLCVLKYLQFEADESWRLDDLRQRILDKQGAKIASEIFEEPLRSAIEQAPTPIAPPTEAPAPATTPAVLPDTQQTAPLDQTAPTTKTVPVTKTTPRVVPTIRTAPRVTPSRPAPTGTTGALPAQKSMPSLASYHRAMASISKTCASMDSRIGSNAFAIAANLSDTKGCLLACDKHTVFTVPDRFYQIGLKSPSIHLVGATVPGVPGILTGRNDFVCFGSVNVRADAQDLILEEFSAQFPNKYRSAEGWQNVTESIEEIPVRLKKNLLHKVLMTKHGPVLSRTETTGVALNWTGSRPAKPIIEALWKMNKAKDISSFSMALDDYQGNPQTFVFADRKGGVAVKVAGAVPDRRRFGGGSVLVPGWLVRQDPPLMKPAELPQDLNGKEGFVIAGEQRIPGHPSIGTPYPTMRIRQILSNYKRSGQRTGLPELGLLQSDQTAPLVELVRSELKRAVDKTELIDKMQITALEQLKNWDGQLTAGSVPAAIYESFINTLAHQMLEPKLGADATAEYMERWPRWTVFVERTLRNHPNQWLPPGQRSYDAFLISTFSMALKGVRVSSEKEDAKAVSWGTLHKATFRHPIVKYVPTFEKMAPFLDVGPTAVGGDQDTVNACNIKPSKDAWNFASTIGPTLRILTDMSDDDKIYANLALGQSGQMISSNRADQLKAWQMLEPHAMAFSAKQMEKQAQHKLILTNQ